jgi:hypothetical protein
MHLPSVLHTYYPNHDALYCRLIIQRLSWHGMVLPSYLSFLDVWSMFFLLLAILVLLLILA